MNKTKIIKLTHGKFRTLRYKRAESYDVSVILSKVTGTLIMGVLFYATCIFLVLYPSSRSAQQVNVCNPCPETRLRLDPLAIFEELRNFVDNLGYIGGVLNRTLEDFLRYPEMEDSDAEYRTLPPLSLSNSGRLRDILLSAYRALTGEIANLNRTQNRNITDHLRGSLCYLWQVLSTIGHLPPCSVCIRTIPAVTLNRSHAHNNIYIAYKRASQTINIIRNHFGRYLVKPCPPSVISLLAPSASARPSLSL